MAKQDQAPPGAMQPKAETKAESAIIFFAVIKAADGEEVRELTEKQLMELLEADSELFNSEKDARSRCEEIARKRVFRAHQVAKAKAKVARERASFAEKHPDLARELTRRVEMTREEEQELLAKRAADAKAKDGKSASA